MNDVYYHFTGDTLRDGRPVPAIGEWLVHEGPIKLCASGLHASRHPFDALTYAPGARLHRVELRGIEGEEADKVVARERRIIASIDAADLLRAFARQCALDVVELWDAPDVVRTYLLTGDETIRAAARAAARAAEAAQDAWAARATAWAAQDAWDAWDAWAAQAAWAAAQAAAWAAQAAKQKQFDTFATLIDAAFTRVE